MAATSPFDELGDWVDPGAIRNMLESVRAAYTAAPGWVQIGLLVMLAVAVVVGILRIAASLAGRLVVTVVIAAIAACVWFYGSDADSFLSGLWQSPALSQPPDLSVVANPSSAPFTGSSSGRSSAIWCCR